ncbi:VOC family protein [Saccharopolyspora taberi]|uniref:VOC family protein n=1 Tax=Saccharopolyspora taberi TaxID=60895 RepID=A0ABN3VB95_9PSEU
MAELDHLVFAGPDLGAAVALVAELTGVRPVPGGRHPRVGTANHLLGLGGGAYLEVIGPDPEAPEPAGPRPFGIDRLVEPGLVSWAVRTPDLESTARAAAAVGYDPGAPQPLSRSTPDGVLLEWRLTPFPSDRLFPFLIDWGETRHPSEGLPVVPLRSLHGVHPRPGDVRPALDALGAGVDVVAGNRVGLVATLEGPGGEIVLS